MVSKQTMITFYLACGYGPLMAVNRAARYIKLQQKFNEVRARLDSMADEDGRLLSEHIGALNMEKKE
jgi:hypothetical protein